MNKTIRLSLLFLLIATRFGGVAYGQYLGKFTLAQTNKTTNPLVYNGAYDSYTFQVESFSPLDASKYDSVGLYFSSSTSSFLETGSTTFLQVASNPTVFGFEAPDTFFVLPAGFHGTPLSVVDTNSTLSVVFTPQDWISLVPVGPYTNVAYFSVPAGTPLIDQGIGITYRSTLTVTPGDQISYLFNGSYGENPAYEGYSFSGPSAAIQPNRLYEHFTWDTTGSPLGTYIVNAHTFAASTQVTIHLVPEPTSILLIVLGAVSCSVFARRRRCCTQ
jgi:hypothetical protein